MARTEKLSHLYDVVGELTYPIDREAAIDATEGITLRLADGEIGLARVIEDTSSREFTSRDDLTIEIMSNLPRRAVGEPYQSEGEG